MRSAVLNCISFTQVKVHEAEARAVTAEEHAATAISSQTASEQQLRLALEQLRLAEHDRNQV